MPSLEPLLLLAAVAVLLGACVQSVSGIGFALVASPALFALTDSAEAVTIVLCLSVAANLLVLFAERRPRAVRWELVAPIVGAALPGLVLGVLALGALSRETLQVLVGVVVLVAVGLQARSTALPAARAGASRRFAYPVGFGAGALTTTTAVNGPPLMVFLLGRGARPEEVRDSLAACFLALNVGGAAAVLALSAERRELDLVLLLILLPLVGVGHAVGRSIFLRFDRQRFAIAALGIATLSGAASVAAGLLG